MKVPRRVDLVTFEKLSDPWKKVTALTATKIGTWSWKRLEQLRYVACWSMTSGGKRSLHIESGSDCCDRFQKACSQALLVAHKSGHLTDSLIN
jgi:hypothetical protein